MRITISSGKGGTGKTTLATNLALFLAETRRVILVDLDVEEPDSGVFIKAQPKNTKVIQKFIPKHNPETCKLCGNCQKVCNFNAIMRMSDQILTFPELCHSCFACIELCPTQSLDPVPERIGEIRTYSAENLGFVEGKLDVGVEQAVPLIAAVKEFVRSERDDSEIVIFDSPPGTSCPVVESVRDSDIIILTTEPTPFGLHDLKLSIELLKKLGKEAFVVLNRFGIGDSGVEEYCESEDMEIVAKIPNERIIAELYARGDTVYDKIPEFKKALTKVVGRIFGGEL